MVDLYLISISKPLGIVFIKKTFPLLGVSLNKYVFIFLSDNSYIVLY